MNPLVKRRVFLLVDEPFLGEGHLRRSFRGLHGSWMYLGKDPGRSLLLDEISPPGLVRHQTGGRLQEIALNSRQAYIDFIGNLPPSPPDLTWWLTSVSEKNPFISDVFLSFCQLRIAIEQVERGEDDILIVCGSRSLAGTLALNLKPVQGIQVEIQDPLLLSGIQGIRDFIRMGILHAWFILRFSLRAASARIFARARASRRAKAGGEERVLIHSWADGRTFGESGRYRDVYFGDLGNLLAGMNLPVTCLVSVLPTYFFGRALARLLGCPEDIHLVEEFIRFRDILLTGPVLRWRMPVIPDPAPMAGLDLAPVLRAEIRKDGLTTRREESYLLYHAAREMGKRCDIRSFIYTFENHIWEKMYCLGLRESSPETLRVGYAHAIVHPMNLPYSLSEHERGCAPLPDRIAVNGPRAKEVLEASGFDPRMIFVTGAFRYPDLERKIRGDHGKPYRSILVALPGSLYEAVELAMKSFRALGGVPHIRLVLKAHPTVPAGLLAPRLPPLPANACFSDESPGDLLARADLVLYTSTTLAVEAAARGVPVIHVKSDLLIDRNVLEGFPDIPSCGDPAELRSSVLEILEHPDFSAMAGGMDVKGFFLPWSEESLKVFYLRDEGYPGPGHGR